MQCKLGIFQPGILFLIINFDIAELNPPEDLTITVEGLTLVAAWSKTSLRGEQLSYYNNHHCEHS